MDFAFDTGRWSNIEPQYVHFYLKIDFNFNSIEQKKIFLKKKIFLPIKNGEILYS